MRRAWILLVAGMVLGAQSLPETEAARARHMLGSPHWQEKAWGAYFAGRLHSSEFQEPLEEAFREAAPLRDATFVTEEWGYVATLFDAAIESGIQVPGTLLQPFEEKWHAPVIILLARDRTAEPSLLRIREQSLGDADWLAVSNVLAALPSPRFFAKALGEVEISHEFTITDPESGDGIGSGTGGGNCGDGILAMPRGFPPAAVYELTDSPQKGDVLLARGPQDAYYRRMVVPTDKQLGVGVCGSMNRQKVTAGYLAPLARMTDAEIDYLFHRHTTIEFHGDADLRQRLDAAFDIQEAGIRDFVRQARQNGLGPVAGMRLRIVPKFNDLRKTTSGPPPALASREFVLE